MNQILHCVYIDYLNGQDVAILTSWQNGVCINKFFPNQAFSVKITEYWSCPFSRDVQKKFGQYSAILTRCLVNNPYALLILSNNLSMPAK